MSNVMFSKPPFGTATAATLQSVRAELKGNIFRNVGGLFAKNFEGKPWNLEGNPWSEAVQAKLQAEGSPDIVSKLSAGDPIIDHLDLLLVWLAEFQDEFFPSDQSIFRFFHSQLLSNAGSKPGACISLETRVLHPVAGSTRVFGEFHHDNIFMADDDDNILRFCERARQVLEAQSARYFVHGFLVCGTTLELWVFDRSGAYSSERFDLTQRPDLLVRALVGYTLMNHEEAGFNAFVKRPAHGLDSHITLHENEKFYLRPELIATADYIVGPGTTCYGASKSTDGKADTVIKFSWREDEELTEVRLLQLAHKRNARGIIQLLGYQDLVSIADLREGLRFPQPFVNRTLSCVATAPLGRPIRQYTSIPELLEVLRDLVRALQSLYVNARILHRDVAIKNLIIAPQRQHQHPHSVDGSKGVLLDFNAALDLDNARPIEPMVGSDGFMAIGILSGRRHTYRHDLESLFYVFLWIAIANDRVHDEANDILKGLPKTSRLWKWCTMDFGGVARDKAADMSSEGFEGILGEFSSDFVPLRGLAKELHALVFPASDGDMEGFSGPETDQGTVQRDYDGMADAFNRSALAFRG
ncbi:hypothetical protein V8F20_012264 [Naviculisporaceae sp. PSN 640]